ncbi:MAG: hypothetical protein IKV53_04015 [Clostridia bacterium]|nr:hypothetical protein [Clostridia bacterium]
MNTIKELKNSIVLENEYIRIELSKKDATVLSVKTTDGTSVAGEKSLFAYLTDKEHNAYENKALTLDGSTLVLETELGKVKIAVKPFDAHFTLEVTSALPKNAYCLVFADIKYDYDLEDRTSYRGVGVAMTIATNPVYFPSGCYKKTVAKVYEHLGDGAKGAKYALAVVPEPVLQDTLKAICSTIDPKKGIVLKTAGPWANENPAANGNYRIVSDVRPEVLDQLMAESEFLGIDQLDIHQNDLFSYRQGDFEVKAYKDIHEFKKCVSERFNTIGVETALHTYAQYIHPNCHGILSDPKNQDMLETNEVFTLAEDIEPDTEFIPTEESTAELSDYYGFFTKNMPYVRIGNEIIKFVNDPHGFAKCERGFSGTTAVSHKKGEKIYHLCGYFNLLVPLHNTDLFKQIARNTADTFNKGGFGMIYLDAIDGTNKHVSGDERSYYIALFVHEILKNCEREPLLELSDMPASVWAARARMGAWDTPYRNFKKFNMIHHSANLEHHRHFYNTTMGWYNFFPATDKYPGNQHTKYHHWDSIDHLGALAIMYNHSTVYNGCNLVVEGYRRNISRYKKYDDLRKAHYFSEATLEKARANPHELAVVERNGKYVFAEKNYEIKRLYDIGDEKRNTETFTNPFKRQTPFIRIENCMSTLGKDPMILLPLNENAPVSEQTRLHHLGAEFNIAQNLAMKVRVKGNGRKGVVAFRLKAGSQSEHGYGLYLIDTDFDGWREFILLEADNGDRPDLPFEKGLHMYPVYRSGLNMDRVSSVELLTDGDVEGVYVSSLTACQQVYNVVKNPTVTIGNETVMFECELMSTDFIEWDGERAVVLDRYFNEKQIWFQGTVTVPKGKYQAKVGFQSSLNNCPVNVYLTVGTTGKEIK